MRSLNLDQLRALCEVLAAGSFSAAARKLNLTQPAVSLQIRELESRLGVRLIERFGKQAHATAPGRDLVEHARKIFAECDAAERTMRRFRDAWIGRVQVGATLTALPYDPPPILRKVRRSNPGIIVRPLEPARPSTLALAEHRNKPNDPALEIVREALMGLCTLGTAEKVSKT